MNNILIQKNTRELILIEKNTTVVRNNTGIKTKF